jgi:hypothetical protein
VMFSGRRLNLFGMKAPRPHPLRRLFSAEDMIFVLRANTVQFLFGGFLGVAIAA